MVILVGDIVFGDECVEINLMGEILLVEVIEVLIILGFNGIVLMRFGVIVDVMCGYCDLVK